MTMYITSPFAMLDRASGKAKKDFDFPEIEEATAKVSIVDPWTMIETL